MTYGVINNNQNLYLHSLVPNNKLRQRKYSNVVWTFSTVFGESCMWLNGKNTPHLENVDVNFRRSNNRTPNWNSAQETRKKTTAERTSLCLTKKKPSTRDRKTAVIAVFFWLPLYLIQFNSLGMQRDKTPHLQCERSRWREGTTDASGQSQFIWSGKVCIWVSLGISQFIAVVSSHLLRTEKPITLITFNMTFMWTFHTNSLLNGYVFYECTWITTYTCIANYLVLAYEGLPIPISHDHFHIILMAVNSILNDIVICNLCFSDYMFPPKNVLTVTSC